MQTTKSYTRKQLIKLTGAKAYTINYLKDCGRLPIVSESKGSGYPILYGTNALEIIKEHISKSK